MTTRRVILAAGVLPLAAAMGLLTASEAGGQAKAPPEPEFRPYEELTRLKLLAGRMSSVRAVSELISNEFGGLPLRIMGGEPGELATFDSLGPMAGDGEQGTDYLGTWMYGRITGPRRKMLTYFMVSLPRTHSADHTGLDEMVTLTKSIRPATHFTAPHAIVVIR